jgi:hypothetical protein
MKSFLFFAGILVSVSYSQGATSEQFLTTGHVRMPLKATPALAAPASASVPMWTGTGGTFKYTMVGQSPTAVLANPTTTITVPIIPLKMVFSDGTTFDPSVVDYTCSSAGSAVSLLAQSPIFNNSTYTPDGTSVGSTQYIDFFQRANFWKYTGPTGVNPNYHVLFTAAPLNEITVNVPANEGRVSSASCGKFGQVNLNWFDNYLQTTVYPQAGIQPTELPVFLTYNVVTYDSAQPNSFILGYHSAFSGSSTGNATQLYAVGDFDTTGIFGSTQDVSDLTHELGETLDDPLGNNPTPAWGNIGQVSGCQTDLEVGDPLSGTGTTVTMTNGYKYHVQELAFASWFYRDSPSIGVNGWYSSNGTFTTSSAACGRNSGATTTTLTLSSTIAGSLATYNVTVAATSASSTPTGNVSLVTSTGSTLTTITLGTNGTATGTITLPASSTNYKVIANYAGSNTFNSSSSPSVAIITTTPLKATVTMLSLGTTALPTGGLDSVAIQVNPASGTGTPTGTVKLVSGTGTTLATLSLTNGSVSGSVNLPAGNYPITAQYSGDITFAASSSAAIAINPGAPQLKTTVTTLSLSSTTVPTGGASVSAAIHVNSATVTPAFSAGTPAGSVTLVSSLGTTFGPFTLSNGAVTASINLPPGNYTITAQYSGDATFAASSSSPVTINPLTPTPGQGQLTLSATSLTFGSVAVGTTSTVQTLTVTNTGTGSSVLLIAILGADPFDFRRNNGCGFSLAAGKACSIQVSFRPTTAGARTASLLVGGLTAASQQKVSLTGAGTGGPQVKLSATSLSFGSSNVGTATAAQTVTLSNTGTGPLTNLFLALTGADPRDFPGTTTCASTVGAGTSCTVSLTFQPTASGARTATLEVAGLGTGAAQTVTLTGTGTGGPQVTLSTASLGFGTSTVGTSTASQTVTVSNSGTSAVSGLSIMLTGENSRDFPATDNCGSSLAAGATCSIQVAFDPRAKGARSATLSVRAGFSGLSASVALTGTGQ